MKGEEVRVVFVNDDLRKLYEVEGYGKGGFDVAIVRSFRKKVGLVEAAQNEVGLRAFKSLNLEKLKGDRAGQWSIRLNDQWRLILKFQPDDNHGRAAVMIEITDYH